MKIKTVVLIVLFTLIGFERAFKISHWFWLNYFFLGVSISTLIPDLWIRIRALFNNPVRNESKEK